MISLLFILTILNSGCSTKADFSRNGFGADLVGNGVEAVLVGNGVGTVLAENDNYDHPIIIQLTKTERNPNLTIPVPPKPCITEYCPTETGKIFCPAEEIEDAEYGLVIFPLSPATPKGNIVRAPCPYGFRDDGTQPISTNLELAGTPDKAYREAHSGFYRKCNLVQRFNAELGEQETIGEWISMEKNSDTEYCRHKIGVTRSNTLVAAMEAVTPFTFKTIYPLMMAFLSNAVDDHSHAFTFIDSISRLMEKEELFFAGDSVLSQLLNLLDSYTKDVILSPGYRVIVNTSAIVLEVANFPEEEHSIQKLNSGYFISSSGVRIPMESVRMAISQNVTPKLQVTTYSPELFFHWSTDTWDSASLAQVSNVSHDDDGFKDSYRVISISFLEADIQNLTEPVTYKLHVNHSVEGKKWSCVFWDPSVKNWSSDGIQTIQLENAVHCESSHMTAFSAILDPIPFIPGGTGLSPITPEHSRILGILSAFGSALSIAGLAITTLTYGLFKCLRKERSNRILFHLCLSLLLLHLMSVTSEKFLWQSNCFFPSSFLHYLLLTSLCWMLVEAFHMFQLLICVFVQPETKFMIKRAAFAWGCPLIIVIICGAVHPEVYMEGRDDLCIIAAHLNKPLYYAGYLGPAVIILAINVVIFCRISIVIYKQGVHRRKHDKLTSTLNKPGKMDWQQMKNARKIKISPTQVKGALTVMILVGVGWVFALFAIGPFQLFFKYLFVICNAGQGVFIFIFRVCLHPLACRTWRTTLLGVSTEIDTNSTSSAMSNKRRSLQSFSVSPTFISASNSVENSLTPSNPLSAKLASNIVSILRSGDESSWKDKDLTSIYPEIP